MAVSCKRCGQEWPRDPALEVPCPTCHAPVGVKCKRPSEHGTYGGQPHAARDRLAMEKVPGYGKCPGTLVRQAKMREDGSITSVPARNSERPQLEKQADLFQFGKDAQALEKLIRERVD